MHTCICFDLHPQAHENRVRYLLKDNDPTRFSSLLSLQHQSLLAHSVRAYAFRNVAHFHAYRTEAITTSYTALRGKPAQDQRVSARTRINELHFIQHLAVFCQLPYRDDHQTPRTLVAFERIFHTQ